MSRNRDMRHATVPYRISSQVPCPPRHNGLGRHGRPSSGVATPPVYVALFYSQKYATPYVTTPLSDHPCLHSIPVNHSFSPIFYLARTNVHVPTCSSTVVVRTHARTHTRVHNTAFTQRFTATRAATRTAVTCTIQYTSHTVSAFNTTIYSTTPSYNPNVANFNFPF